MRITTTNPIHNFMALDRQIEAAFPGMKFQSGTRGPGQVFVEVADDTDSVLVQQLQNVLDTFDEAQVPQTEAEQAYFERLAALQQHRQENVVPLNVGDYANADRLIHTLAIKVAWLEAELRMQRAGNSIPAELIEET